MPVGLCPLSFVKVFIEISFDGMYYLIKAKNQGRIHLRERVCIWPSCVYVHVCGYVSVCVNNVYSRNIPVAQSEKKYLNRI